jgi:hypothetical protein
MNYGPNSALDDLKELPYPVRERLLRVVREELRQTPRTDNGVEGRIFFPGSPHEWLWRRGITSTDLATWIAGRTPGPDVCTAAEYLIVYAFFTRAQARLYRYDAGADYPGFYVWRILHNSSIAEQAVRSALPASLERH